LRSDLENILLENIFEKICVFPPYFAFKKVLRSRNVLIAPIEPEQTIEFEATPMASAEAGRHLAILGSCCFLDDENEAKYYLASKALKRSGKNHNFLFDKSKKLYVIAAGKSSQKTECLSYSALINEDGEIIFEMDISFQKLSKKLFNRFFKEHLKPTDKIDYNPYKNCYDRLKNITEEGFVIKAELPKVSNDKCAGHFDGAPILPAGIMSYVITNQIGEMLKKIDNDNESNFYLLEADLNLFEPTNIDQKEFVEIKYLSKEGNSHKLFWEVKSESGKVRNNMKLSFGKRHEI
jgi:hypothetical protein